MKIKSLLTFALFLISAFIFAQDTVTISGTIVDEKKQPLPGATIVVKGTGIGTTADDAGKYTLHVPKDSKTIIISYIGYDSKEIPFDPTQKTLNVSMAGTSIALNQVVVSVSKRQEKILDAPAAITVIGQTQLEDNVVTTPVDELKGTSGVDIIRTGLISSDVVIRGFNNIFSGEALNVIDNRIGSVPSLRVNAYQLVATDELDYQKIEVVQGPASALYGPNASSGVIAITTKSPLDQEKQFETTVAMTSGFTVLAKSYQQYNGGSPFSGNILNPEIRHSGKLFKGKLGYKISGSYFQGKDYPNYSPSEPKTGDSLIFGTVRNGQVFQPDTLGYTVTYDTARRKYDTAAKLDIRKFNKDFFIRKYTGDARIDFRPVKDVTITVNGGISSSHNLELTGLGTGVAGGDNGGWIYWYFQTRFKWKNLFIQYYLDASNSGSTYLIPQVSPGSTPPYDVQLLIDRSKMHVFQIQHSWAPIQKLHFVYGVDVQLTRPNTEGTIDGRFEPIAKLNQVGAYLQGTYDVLKWFTIVAAIRADYNSIIENVAASPRAALVFKPAENQDIRITYNRAFDSPNTLDQFLDLSNGLIPNGINVRGIGNPFGWNYNYDANGVPEFQTAPWGGAYNSGSWVSYNSTAANAQMFDSLMNYMVKLLAPSAGGVAAAQSIVNALFNGISGTNGTVASASHQLINYATFAQTGNFPASLENINSFQNLKKINNQYTQTVELGYKALLFHKLSLQVDGYWTHISNYVSPLRSASGAVMLNAGSYLGPYNSTGKLYQNLYADDSLLNKLLAPLDGTPALQNSTITQPMKGTVWDEINVLTYKFPIGTVTPNSPYVGADYILTYENLGSLDIFGGDLTVQYPVFETNLHNITIGVTADVVNKNQLRLTTGDTVPLNAPIFKGAVTFDHTLKESGFGYGLSFRYQTGYYGNSAIYFGQVKPAYLLDLRVSYRPKFSKGLLFAINVNNALNYQWSSFPGTPLMGTQFYARVQYTF